MQVLLADDETKVCSALRLLLEDEPDLCVVGEVVDAKSLLNYLAPGCKPNRKLKCSLEGKFLDDLPGLLLLDWELPGFQAAEQLPALRASCPEMKIVALSARGDARQSALNAGADAFVSKADPPDRLLETLRGVVKKNR